MHISRLLITYMLSLASLIGCGKTNSTQNVFTINGIDIRRLKADVISVEVLNHQDEIDCFIEKKYFTNSRNECVNFIDYLSNSKIEKCNETTFGSNNILEVFFHLKLDTFELHFNNNVCFDSNYNAYYFQDYKPLFGLDPFNLETYLPFEKISKFSYETELNNIQNENNQLSMSYCCDYSEINRCDSSYYLYENSNKRLKFYDIGNDIYLFDCETSTGNVFVIPNTILPSNGADITCDYRTLTIIHQDYELSIKCDLNSIMNVETIKKDVVYYLINCHGYSYINANAYKLYLDNTIITNSIKIEDNLFIEYK